MPGHACSVQVVPDDTEIKLNERVSVGFLLPYPIASQSTIIDAGATEIDCMEDKSGVEDQWQCCLSSCKMMLRKESVWCLGPKIGGNVDRARVGKSACSYEQDAERASQHRCACGAAAICTLMQILELEVEKDNDRDSALGGHPS